MYADYKDQTNQTLVHILGTFLQQLLVSAQEPIPNEVFQKLDDIQRQGRKAGIEDYLPLLIIRLIQLKRAFICIDAIDELEPRVRQQLLHVLKDLATNHNTCLFLTGRGHIEWEVQACFEVVQRCAVSASEQDIREFVRQQINEDRNPKAMDEVLAERIEDAIIKRSQGM